MLCCGPHWRGSQHALTSRLLAQARIACGQATDARLRAANPGRNIQARSSCRSQLQWAQKESQAHFTIALVALSAAMASLISAMSCQAAMQSDDNFNNIPGQLSGGEQEEHRMKGPQSKQAEACIRNCIPTCIRGGEGAPGLGPLSVRKDLVRFKDGYRSRSYCLQECGYACSLKPGQQ